MLTEFEKYHRSTENNYTSDQRASFLCASTSILSRVYRLLVRAKTRPKSMVVTYDVWSGVYVILTKVEMSEGSENIDKDRQLHTATVH